MAVNIREVFGLRAKLHKSVYQHHVVKAVGHMIGDCLAAAAPFFRVNGKTLTECAETIEDFSLLGDWVLDAVGSDPTPQMAEARGILGRLRRRDLYTLAGSVNVVDAATFAASSSATASSSSGSKLSPSALSEEVILSMLGDTARRMGVEGWDPSQVIVDIVVINHGKGAADPLAFVDFFNPKTDSLVEGDGAVADSTPLFRLAGGSPLLSPSSFEERTIMVFSKRREATGAVRRVFDAWRRSDEVSGLLFEGLSFHNPRI